MRTKAGWRRSAETERLVEQGRVGGQGGHRGHRLECATGMAQVDVVEGRPRDGRGAHGDAGRLDGGDGRRDDACAVVGAGAHGSALADDLVEQRDPGEALGRNGSRCGVGQLEDEAVAAQLALELVGSPGCDDASVVDDGEPIGEVVGLVEVVRRQQDGHPLGARHPGDLRPHLGASLRVEAGRRLVEEEDHWAVDQADGDVELAVHAAAVGLGEPVGRLGEVEAVEQLVSAFVRGRSAEALDAGGHDEALAAGHHRRGARLLGDQTDAVAHRARVAQHVVPGDGRAARVGPGEGRQDADRCRLAGAVGAEQTKDLAGVDGQAEAVESPDGRLPASGGVGLDEVGGDERHWCGRGWCGWGLRHGVSFGGARSGQGGAESVAVVAVG